MPFQHSHYSRAFGCAALLAAAVPAAVGDWVSYSDYSVSRALISYHGELFAGTGGGVRRIDVKTPYPFRETDYNNMQGLADVRIVAFTVDPDDRLWAGSRSGQIFRLEGKTWSAWGKSYASAGWTLNPRALGAAGRYLILGSDQGLSLFDRKTGTAAVNLTKFATLGRQPITSVFPAGDTLYIVAGGSVLYARFDWSDANSGKYGAAISDPSIWKPATNLGRMPDWVLKVGPHDTLVGAADSGFDVFASRPVELSRIGGALIAHDTGTLMDSRYRIKALHGRQNYVDGKTFGVLHQCEAAAVIDKSAFLAGSQGLFWYNDTGWAAPIDPPGPVPSTDDLGIDSRLTAVTARAGSALLLSGTGIYRFDRGKAQEIMHFGYISPDIANYELRNLTFLEDGGYVYGAWGFGLTRVGPNGEVHHWSSANSCLKAVLSPDFTVIQNISDPLGNDLWLTLLENTAAQPVFLMAHLDLATNTVTCPEVKGSENTTLSTRILSDTLFAVAGDKNMSIFRYGIAGTKSSIEPFGKVDGGSGADGGRDMQMDGYGRLWALMNGRIGYVDSLADKVGENKNLEITNLDGFTGVNCTVLETDARHGLWAGCENGMYHLTPQAQPELTQIDHYTVNDGLLADRIIDLAVDKQTGMVWATTEQGVNTFLSQAHPVLSSVDGVRVYPNPFRAQHRVLVIDNVPKGATGVISTQDGEAVRRFGTSEMLGSQFQWDGKNGAGRTVTPGVYFYSVSARGKTSRGKIIVAR